MKNIAGSRLAGKQNASRGLPRTFESRTISCGTSQVKPPRGNPLLVAGAVICIVVLLCLFVYASYLC